MGARIQSVSFADIQHLSAISDEKEVLFSLGSTFQIISVYFNDETNLSVIRLNASDEGSGRIREYFELADHELKERSPLTYFGEILTDNLDQPDRAIRYFRGLLQLLDRNHPDRMHIYDLLGEAFSRKNDHTQARKYFVKMRAMHRNREGKTLEPDIDVIAEDLRRKLDMEEKRTNEATLEKARLMFQLSHLVETIERKVWLRRACETYERLNLPNRSFSICLDELAWTYRLDMNDKQNIDTLYQHLVVAEQYLPPENQQLCDMLEDIIRSGINLYDDRRFVDFCQKNLFILNEKHTDNHPRLIHMQRCLEEVSAKIHQFEQIQAALINIFETSAIDDLAQRSWCLGALTNHNYRYSLYDQSVRYALEDLQIHQKIYSDDHPNTVHILSHIAICYDQLGDYQQAFDYIRQILILYESSGNPNADALSMVRDSINKIVVKAKKHHIDLPWNPHMDHDRCATVEKSTEENNRTQKSLPWWAIPKSAALRQALNLESTTMKDNENKSK